MNTFQFAFSPCPNDTFAFEAMIHGKIDTEGLQFIPHLADVETLNHAAFREEMPITKLSYHACAHVADRYQILPSGSALGTGNGPLLVSRQKIYPDELGAVQIAIPGRYTTAALLLKIAYPHIARLHEYIFSDIEEAVLSNEMDAGVLIHEGRFTYAQKGLRLIADLGQLWEQRTGQAIPLGCIAVSRKLDEPVRQQIARIVRRSVAFALRHPKESAAFVRQHAQEMNPAVTQQHIQLYVNDYSVDLGNKGKQAVHAFFAEAVKAGAVAALPGEVFVS